MPIITDYLIRIRELELALVRLDTRLARLTAAAREVCDTPQDEAALVRLRALVGPGVIQHDAMGAQSVQVRRVDR